jgi:uncharacterized membrane protein (DUF2068 family)
MLSRMRRPLGVTIIAILVAIGGIAQIIFGLQFLGIIAVVLGILTLVLAWGLWTLQPWAFWSTIILEAINAVENLLNIRYGGSIIGLLIPVVIIAYMLLDRNVRVAFRT